MLFKGSILFVSTVSSKLQRNPLLLSKVNRFSNVATPGFQIDSKITTSEFQMQGGRDYMEDRTVIGFDNRLAAVFDGHAGYQVAETLKLKFLSTLTAKWPEQTHSKLSNDEIVKGLKNTLHEIDTFCLNEKKFDEVGAAATMSIVHLETPKPVIITANVGDSRVVLSSKKKAINLTEDHKPDLPSEKARIEKLGE